MKKLLFILLAGSTLVFNSCSKKGDTGPQGPQGPQGNANVIGSDPFTVTLPWDYNSSEVAYEASFIDNDVTNAVANHGIVELFLFYSSDNTWRVLPDIYGGTQVYFRFSAGGYDIYYGNVNGTTPSYPSGTWTFRKVVIYPSNRIAHPNTNWSNYQEVMAALEQDRAAAATKK